MSVRKDDLTHYNSEQFIRGTVIIMRTAVRKTGDRAVITVPTIMQCSLFQNPSFRFAHFGETVHALVASCAPLSAGSPASDFRQHSLQTAGAYWQGEND
jgi:hypothetical protein